MTTALVDPTGKLLTTIRDDAGVAAITTIVRADERQKADAPPMVVINYLGGTRLPWGRSAARLGSIDHRYSVLCYAAKSRDKTVQGAEDGKRRARALANAVSAAIHLVGPIRYSYQSGHAFIAQIVEESRSAVLADPLTQEPYVALTVSLIAGAQVAA